MRILRLLRETSLASLSWATITGIISGLMLTLMIRQIHQAISAEPVSIWLYSLQFLGIWVLFLVNTHASTVITSRLSHDALYHMRNLVKNQILQVYYPEVEHIRAELFPVLTEDINQITHTIYKFPGILTASATIAGCIFYMLYLSWEITVAILLIFILIYIVMSSINRYAKEYYNLARKEFDKIYHYFEDLIYGLKELKMDSRQRSYYQETLFHPLIKKHQDYKLRGNILTTLSIRSIELIFFPSIAAIIVVISIYNTAAISTFSGILTVLLFLLSPLSTIGNFISEFKNTEISMKRVEDLGELVEKHQESTQQQKTIPPATETSAPILELQEIVYTYENPGFRKGFKLGPVTVAIPGNQITFIIGDNGCGKSTLGKIITGLYLPQKGAIRYKDISIQPAYLSDYRSRFSTVFSDFHLFQFADLSNVNVDWAQTVLDDMEISHLVSLENWDVVPTELSQGQRERLAFATALIQPKEIFLLDEVAANQDAGFKEKIYTEIIPRLKEQGKTVIVISHDAKYFNCADNIIKLDQGKLV